MNLFVALMEYVETNQLLLNQIFLLVLFTVSIVFNSLYIFNIIYHVYFWWLLLLTCGLYTLFSYITIHPTNGTT
jgi:hypothetical protein